MILAASAFVAQGQSADEFLKKCDAAYGKANYADAVKHCTKAIEKRPGFEEAIMARAFAYEKLGNIDAAIADHTELIRLTGMAQFYFYRAGIYLDRGKKDDALADLTAAIKKEPAGRYAARCHYQRGLIYEERGKTTDAQADFRRAVQLNPDLKDAAARIKPQPKTDILDDGPLSTAADRIVENIFVGPKSDSVLFGKDAPRPPDKPNNGTKPATTPPSFKRMSLTGTGLSAVVPEAYKLVDDKPDPLNETMAARVMWELKTGALWGTLTYYKWDQGFKSMRENMEKTVSIMFWDDKAAVSQVRETTFLGQPAAYIEKEYLNRYSKTQVWQKILIFGKPNDYVSINFQHPAGDKASAQMVSQIMASFQKEGDVAVAESKTAPTDWKLYEFQGLLFEAPTAPGTTDCFGHPAGQSFVCSNWSDNSLKIDVAYQVYADYERKRSAAELAARGNAFWKVTVYNFNRWDAVRDAAKRAAGSIRFKN